MCVRPMRSSSCKAVNWVVASHCMVSLRLMVTSGKVSVEELWGRPKMCVMFSCLYMASIAEVSISSVSWVFGVQNMSLEGRGDGVGCAVISVKVGF